MGARKWHAQKTVNPTSPLLGAEAYRRRNCLKEGNRADYSIHIIL